MGQMIKVIYIGAYLDVDSEDFQEIVNEDEFYEEVKDEHFLSPYQGLEEFNILIPSVDDYKMDFDTSGEFIIDSLNLNKFEEKLKDGYSEQIKVVEKYFPGKVSVKSGLVCYWDEVA